MHNGGDILVKRCDPRTAILPHSPEKRSNFFVQAERVDIQFTIALFVYIIGRTKASGVHQESKAVGEPRPSYQ